MAAGIIACAGFAVWPISRNMTKPYDFAVENRAEYEVFEKNGNVWKIIADRIEIRDHDAAAFYGENNELLNYFTNKPLVSERRKGIADKPMCELVTRVDFTSQ
jgi:hypothetical protein